MMPTIYFKSVDLVLRAVNYAVNYDEERRVAEITPIIDSIAERDLLMLVSLEVDGHELLPPRRTEFPAGVNQVKLSKIKIVNPLNRQPGALEHRNHAYRMACKISTIGREIKLHASDLTI